MPGKMAKGHLQWICKCDCGNECCVDSGNLSSGHTQSCGHCEKYISLDAKTIKCDLPDGGYFLISPEDYEVVSQYKWSIESNGYPHTTIDGKHIRLHKLIMGNANHIDHRSGDTLDNRRENLRMVTNQQNHWNMKKSKKNTSGYKGVSFDKRRGRYSSNIMKDGKNIFLGYFNSPIDAAIAYDNAAFLYFGEYARPNFKKGENPYEQKQEVLELDNTSTE